MRKIKWSMTNGLIKCKIGGEFEVEDDATEEDINDLVVDEMWDYINLHWEEVND